MADLQYLRDTLRGHAAPGQSAPANSLGIKDWFFPESERNKGRGRSNLLTVGSGGLARDHTSARMRDYASYMNAVYIPTVYKAVSVIAANFAACLMTILDDDNEAIDLKTADPKLWRLLRNPNPEVDCYTFLESMAFDLCLTGNFIAALDSPEITVDDEMNVGLLPTEMWRLDPSKVRIRRNKAMSLEYGYDVEIDGKTETIWYDGQTEIIHWKFWNPNNPLWGLGVVEANEISLSSDRRFNELKYNYFDRGAILDGVLTTEGDMDDDEYDRLLTRWKAVRGGKKGMIKTAILWQGAKYQPIQEPLGNIPVVELSRMSRNDILEAFTVPPQKIGDFQDANYSNGREADALFWDECMVPLFRRCEPGWNKLVKMFKQIYHVAYEARQITDFQMRATTSLALAQTGAFTRNDIRVAGGYDPLPEGDPLGDVFIGSTRQAVWPGEYADPLDLLPMTESRLLSPEEFKTRMTRMGVNPENANGGAPGMPSDAAGATPGDRPAEKVRGRAAPATDRNAGRKAQGGATLLDPATWSAEHNTEALRAGRRSWPKALERSRYWTTGPRH